ncbi:hypothetical protein PV433_10885 [Paenibacillus sp. GYB004]|uniref:hypothetical protein n=1 Tax=Paenibacillus sp. GYB004 TaxID=2994393 RepID=UPI002F960E6A
MAKIYQFPAPNRRSETIRDLFSEQEYRHYIQYVELGEKWRQEEMDKTLYEGYPFKAPCEPIRCDMTWYVNEGKKFGVWVINESQFDLSEYDTILFGWSPFVRFSSAPPHEPIHVTSTELRERLVWYVDSEGYGQYATVNSNQEIWIPIPRPSNWIDHNKINGFI